MLHNFVTGSRSDVLWRRSDVLWRRLEELPKSLAALGEVERKEVLVRRRGI